MRKFGGNDFLIVNALFVMGIMVGMKKLRKQN
jgi:hypothetical protein